jgi:hypothetical protein
MSEVEELEMRFRNLPSQDQAKLRGWFHKFDNEVWDRQIEEDIAAGRLDALAEEAIEDLRQGRCTGL